MAKALDRHLSPLNRKRGRGFTGGVCPSQSQALPKTNTRSRCPNTAAAEGGVGMTVKARQCAAGALFELDETMRGRAAPKGADDGAVKEHIMLSYNWSHQGVVKRVNRALQARGYAVWIDIEKMQGSTVEVMSAAVEDAAVLVYGISQAYKESANCRLEAQYAYQRQKEMIPVLLEEGYRADGWLGMLLGVRLWYAFYGTVLSSEAAFEGKMEELCREIGDRGRVTVTSAAVGNSKSAEAIDRCLSDTSQPEVIQPAVVVSRDRVLMRVIRMWRVVMQACGAGGAVWLLFRLMVARRRRAFV